MDFLKSATVIDVTHAQEVTFPVCTRPLSPTREMHGIACAIDGELTYYYDGGSQVLDKDKIVLLPKGSRYVIKCTKPGRFAIINFKTAEETSPDGYECVRGQGSVSVYMRNFRKMQKLLAYDRAGGRAELFSCMYSIISAILIDRESRSYPSPLSHALNYIEENIGRADMKNSDISDSVGISEVYMRKLFVKHLNTSIKEYVRCRRIDLARAMLNDTAKSVTEIADECGYSGIYHFCRSFKANIGVTPGEYRENNRNLAF